MRYETQADLLRLLDMVCRHFSATSLSLKVTRSFDAARILTMGCVATIADVIARTAACDIPSEFSLHYSGAAEGPSTAFGFEMGQFAKESEFLQFITPELCGVRTQVLDYVEQQLQRVAPDHLIFRFEKAALCCVGVRLRKQLM